jgi:hypothetical protein
MARVRLGRYEAEEGRLPPVCMCCGAPADLTKAKLFNWHPGWVYALILVGLLPFLIVALVLTKRMRVRAPVCAAHTYYWTWRSLFVLGGFLALVLVGIAAIVLMASTEGRQQAHNMAGLFCVGVAVLGLVWLVAAAVIQNLTIRPVEITDRDITLIKVSREFADALQEARQRRRRDEDEDDDRPRRRSRYDEEEEDDEEYYRRR